MEHTSGKLSPHNHFSVFTYLKPYPRFPRLGYRCSRRWSGLRCCLAYCYSGWYLLMERSIETMKQVSCLSVRTLDFDSWKTWDQGKKFNLTQSGFSSADIGAAHRGWFSPGCTLVFIFYAMTLLAERWLRRRQRIPQAISKTHRYWGYSTAIHGIFGGLSLMMLSWVTKFNHPTTPQYICA